MIRHPRLGGLLLAYGVLGAAMLVAALWLGAPAVAQLDRMAGLATDALASAADAADASADATDGLGASLEQARSSATEAAALSRDASTTAAALARAMTLSIFGAQPLIGLEDDFATSSEQLQQLAGELDGMAVALDRSDEDLADVSRRLRMLSADLDSIRAQAGTDADPTRPPLLAIFLAVVLLQAIPVVASLALGVTLLRRSPA